MNAIKHSTVLFCILATWLQLSGLLGNAYWEADFNPPLYEPAPLNGQGGWETDRGASVSIDLNDGVEGGCVLRLIKGSNESTMTAIRKFVESDSTIGNSPENALVQDFSFFFVGRVEAPLGGGTLRCTLGITNWPTSSNGVIVGFRGDVGGVYAAVLGQNEWEYIDGNPYELGIQPVEIGINYRFLVEVRPQEKLYDVTLYDMNDTVLGRIHDITIREGTSAFNWVRLVNASSASGGTQLPITFILDDIVLAPKVPHLALDYESFPALVLSVRSVEGADYVLQRSFDLIEWTSLPNEIFPGTGDWLNVFLSQRDVDREFYRFQISGPGADIASDNGNHVMVDALVQGVGFYTELGEWYRVQFFDSETGWKDAGEWLNGTGGWIPFIVDGQLRDGDKIRVVGSSKRPPWGQLTPAELPLLESFEDGASMWKFLGNATHDTRVSHSGFNSVRLTRNSNSMSIVEARRKLNFVPGARLLIGGQVKAPIDWRGLDKLEDYGAYIGVEWYDKDRNLLGKSAVFQRMTEGNRYTGDWEKIGGQLYSENRRIPLNGDSVTPELPEETDSVELVLSLSRDTEGTFWFDDVEAKAIPSPLLVVEWQGNARRRLIARDEDSDLGFRYRVNLGATNWNRDQLAVQLSIWDENNNLIESELLSASAEWTDHWIHIASNYESEQFFVHIVVKEKTIPGVVRSEPDPQWGYETGNAIEGVKFVFTRVPEAVGNLQIGINSVQQWVIDGKETFLTALYLNTPVGNNGGAKAIAELQHIASAGCFDAVLNYGIMNGTLAGIQIYLDAAESMGLGVIFSLKDVGFGSSGPFYVPEAYRAGLDHMADDPDAIVTEIVQTFRNHPAIIAWYISDEDSLYKVKSLIGRYELIRRLDPIRPIFGAQITTDFEYYSETADILGMHQYPVARHQGYPYGFRTIYENVYKASRLLKSKAVLSFACQIFEYHAFYSDLPSVYPDVGLVRNMAWQALIGGANMLMGYSYSYIIPGYRNVGGGAVGTGLHGSRFNEVVVPVFSEIKEMEEWLLSTNEALEVSWSGVAPADVIGRWWRRGDDWMLLTVNTSSVPVQVSVDLSSISGGIIRDEDGTFSWQSEWEIHLQPYGTYRLRILPSQD